MTELIGELNPDNGAWFEGQLTAAIRDFSEDSRSLRKWVHVDGPMDYEWAENLNSVLDENK